MNYMDYTTYYGIVLQRNAVQLNTTAHVILLNEDKIAVNTHKTMNDIFYILVTHCEF